MYSKLRLLELKNTNVKTNIIFFIKLTKVLEVANFRFFTILVFKSQK